MLRSYDPQIGRFLQADPFDEFASGYVGMGNDPVNLVDPSGGGTELPMVFVTAASKVSQTGSQVAKIVTGASTTLKVVSTTYHIYQNSTGEQFETTNPGLGSSTSYNDQTWNKVGSRTEEVHVEDDELPSQFSGDRWQQRLKYYYQATREAANGEDPWLLAASTWNRGHSLPAGNKRITRDGFWSGGEETISVSPTAIELTDGPETWLAGGGLYSVGCGFVMRGGAKTLVKQSLKSKYDDLFAEATKKFGGNVTVQRKGKDLFRVHQSTSGHGYKVDQLNRVRKTPKGPMPGKQKVPIRRKHIKQLERALRGDPNYSLRTSSGK